MNVASQPAAETVNSRAEEVEVQLANIRVELINIAGELGTGLTPGEVMPEGHGLESTLARCQHLARYAQMVAEQVRDHVGEAAKTEQRPAPPRGDRAYETAKRAQQ